jgi:Trk K+ transport system NAD-binding subunit
MEIISPEIGFASQLAKKLARRDLKQVLELGQCELIEAAVPESMFGCSLKELRVGAEHGVLVIGVRRGGALLNDNDNDDDDEPDSDKDESRIMPAGAETRLEKDDTFTLVGRSEALRDFLDLRLDR